MNRNNVLCHIELYTNHLQVETNYTKATREEVNKKNPESEETPDMTEITSKENINSQYVEKMPSVDGKQ